MAIKQQSAICIATACGIGRLPFAPGTFGSLPGLGCAALLHYSCGSILSSYTAAGVWLGVILVLSLVGWWAIQVTEQAWQSHDPRAIVMDEVVGQLIAASLVGSLWGLGLAFFTFRLFDVWKPGPIRWVDQRHTPLSTLLDDVAAGVLSAVVVYLIVA